MTGPGWGDGSDDPQVAQALAAERDTLSLACRSDPRRLEAYLANDFHEFGRSGGELVRKGTAARVAADTLVGGDPVLVFDLRGLRVTDGVVLVKYTSASRGHRLHRTSLWRRVVPGRWQIFHHQGTPTASGS